MGDTLKGQVQGNAAEVYEAVFVPAVFQQWADRLAETVRLGAGDHVLDVACGTGAFARTATHRIAPGGEMVGLDVNEAMLAVARKKAPDVDWRQGSAEALPFEAETFDVVVSQFGLMFFEDRVQALSEMWRVLRPGGRLAVSVWDRIETSPGYAALAALVEELFGEDAAEEIRQPFRLGQPAELRRLAEEAGIEQPEVRAIAGTVRYDSLDVWMTVEVKGWTLSDKLDDAQFEALLAAAPKTLRRYAARDGTVRFPMPAQVLVAKKR